MWKIIINNGYLRLKPFRNPQTGAFDQDMLKKVYDVIEELPDQSKIIFKRCVLDGKKYKEVAEEMNISVNTVNTQMSRAYKFIRSRLGASFLILLSVI